MTPDEFQQGQCPVCRTLIEPAADARLAAPAPPRQTSRIWRWVSVAAAISLLGMLVYYALIGAGIISPDRPEKHLLVAAAESEMEGSSLPAMASATSAAPSLPAAPANPRPDTGNGQQPKIDPKIDGSAPPPKGENGGIATKGQTDAPSPGRAQSKEAPPNESKRTADEPLGVMHIKLDDPQGEYAVPATEDGDVLKITGRIGTLKVPGGYSNFLLDASQLAAKSVDVGAIHGQSGVAVNAPEGSVSAGGATDQATLAINAPNGKVSLSGGVSKDAKVTVTAKEVDIQGPIWDAQAKILITLSKGGKLRLQDLHAGRIYYKRADPADPEPIVEVTKIPDGNVDVREFKGKEPEEQPANPRPELKITLNEPEKDFNAGKVYGEKEVKLVGRVKSFSVEAMSSGVSLDVSGLQVPTDTAHIPVAEPPQGGAHAPPATGTKGYSFGKIGPRCTIVVDSPGAEVHLGGIQGRSTATINVPNGTVTVGIVNDAKLIITAREVNFSQGVSGHDTRIMVTLTKGGTLKAARVSSGQLYYCKADPKDPEPTVDLGRIAPKMADVRRLDDGN